MRMTMKSKSKSKHHLSPQALYYNHNHHPHHHHHYTTSIQSGENRVESRARLRALFWSKLSTFELDSKGFCALLGQRERDPERGFLGMVIIMYGLKDS